VELTGLPQKGKGREGKGKEGKRRHLPAIKDLSDKYVVGFKLSR